MNVVHGPLKHTGCKILRVMEVPCSIVYVIENALHIPLVKLPKGIPITLRSKRQYFLFVEFDLRHDNSYRRVDIYNPNGF